MKGMVKSRTICFNFLMTSSATHRLVKANDFQIHMDLKIWLADLDE